jgi:hypothetical protein
MVDEEAPQAGLPHTPESHLRTQSSARASFLRSRRIRTALLAEGLRAHRHRVARLHRMTASLQRQL